MLLKRRVVALGGGQGLPALMRGIVEAFLPREESWASFDGDDRLSSIDSRGDSLGMQKLGSLVLTSLNDLRRVSYWALERAGDPSARMAIAAADLIVLGPGSVSTNLLPVLRVREVAEEIGRSRARVVLAMNLMTEPGGSDGYVASDFVRAIRRHAPEVPIHDVLLNDAPIRSDLVVSCARDGALPIGYDPAALEALGCRPLRGDLLWDGPAVRHDPRKIGRAILGLVADLDWTGTAPVAPAPQGFSPKDSVAAR